MRKRWFAGASATVAVAAAAAASAGVFAAPAGAVSAHAAASSTLTMESSQEPTVVDNFNPFITTDTTSIGAPTLIYESLLQFDIAKPTQAPYDFLATKFKWNPGGTSITFTIRKNVKFSNGKTMTPKDVAFTYDLVGANKDANGGGLDLATPAAKVKGNTVTVYFTASAYTELQYIGTVPIVEQSIWSHVGDPGKHVDTHPVGTGPYVLKSENDTAGIVLVANKKYWGGPWAKKAGPPAVKEVQFPTFASTSDVLSALENNSLDWAGNFISGLSAFTSGAGHAVWFAGVNTNSLIPNLRTWPMNNLCVRQAVSLAINRGDISSTGESGLEPPATNASGIVLPNFASQEASAVSGDTLSSSPGVAAADAALTGCSAANGGPFTLDSKGYYSQGGQEVDITITDPSDYTDYASDDTIMAANLQSAHMNGTFDGLADAAWYSDLAAGTFGSATSHWSNSAITLWGLYDGWLDSTLNNGSGSGDFEGLNNSTVDSELATLGTAGTAAAIKADAAPLEEYVAANLPVIPTVYGASFDEYNSGAFSGWPTASNAYESGSPNTPTNEVIVLHLKPAK
jgi:peptide/nickel transport system substrate-binding protein